MTDLRARLGDLESRADRTESDTAWDALEPDLAVLRGDLFRAEQAANAALEAIEAEAPGGLERLNPFSRTRREASARRAAQQEERESLGHVRQRLDVLYERYWADKERPFLREWVRRAEKIQREVPGRWETKAEAVAGGVLLDLDTDETIARANRFVADPMADRVMLAAFIGRRSLDEMNDFLARVKKKNDDALGAAFLLGDRDPQTAVALFERLNYTPTVVRAALASDRDFAGIERVCFHTADRSEIVTIGALVCDVAAESIPDRLRGLLGAEDDVAAFSLSSDRDDDEAQAVDAAVRRVIRGDREAERIIRHAACASNRTAPAAAAIVTQLEQQLSGSWTSEATIIGAALLVDGSAAARRSLALR